MLEGNADKNIGTRFRKFSGGVESRSGRSRFRIAGPAGRRNWTTVPPLRRLRLAGNTPTVDHQHYLTDRRPFHGGGRSWGSTGDADARWDLPRVAKKTRIFKVRENVGFSEVVAILEDRPVAARRIEVCVDFQGKTYILSFCWGCTGDNSTHTALIGHRPR